VDAKLESSKISFPPLLVRVVCSRSRIFRERWQGGEIALAESDRDRDWAIEVYQRARPGYHPLTRQAAERALGLEGDQ
jgi:hypothetical protein